MCIILDKLPHGRNIAKGQGDDAPIPPCPLCHEGKDSLEHLTHYNNPFIRNSYIAHFQELDKKRFCNKRELRDSVLSLARAYLFACANTELSDIDVLGGWTGIPSPRFLYFCHPNILLSDSKVEGLRQLLERSPLLSRSWTPSYLYLPPITIFSSHPAQRWTLNMYSQS